MAQVVQDAKQRLLDALPDEQSRLGYEDRARRIAQDPDHPDQAPVRDRLLPFITAVNRLWVAAMNDGMDVRLAGQWMKRQRRHIGRLSKQDVEAEANFALRRAITGFQPGRGGLQPYAARTVFRELDRWLARERSPVGMSKHRAADDARSQYPNRKIPLEVLDTDTDSEE